MRAFQSNPAYPAAPNNQSPLVIKETRPLPKIPRTQIALLHGNDPFFDSISQRLQDNFNEFAIALDARSMEEIRAIDTAVVKVVLVDFELPGDATAIECVRTIRSIGARAITLSGPYSADGVIKAMAAGADAALKKSDSSKRIADQIRLSAARG